MNHHFPTTKWPWSRVQKKRNMFRYTVYQIVADISHCWCPMKYAHCFLVKCKSPNISVQFIHIIYIYIYRDYHHHHPEVFEYGIFKNIPNFAGMVSIFYLLQDEISISFISIYSFSQVSHHDGYTPRWFRLCAWQPLGTAPVAVRDYPQCSQKTSVVTSLGWEILHHAGSLILLGFRNETLFP